MAHTIEYPDGTTWFICKPLNGVGMIACGEVSPDQVMDTDLSVVETFTTKEAFDSAIAAIGFRVLLLVPEGLEFSALPQQAQDAINSIFGQYVMPMPDTQAVDGLVVCDAVTTSDFKPETMADYGITWPIIGMINAKGDVIVPLNQDAYTSRRVDGELKDGHYWAGWPSFTVA